MILRKKFNSPSQLWSLPVFIMVFAMASIISVTSNAQSKSDPHSFKMVEMIDTITTFDPATYAESVEIVESQIKVYDKADVMPLYSLTGCEEIEDQEARRACGNKNLLSTVYKNVLYPVGTKKEGIVVLKFIIDAQGNMLMPEILRSFDPVFSKAVLDMYKEIDHKKWIPGRENDQNVAVSFVLPVKFKWASK